MGSGSKDWLQLDTVLCVNFLRAAGQLSQSGISGCMRVAQHAHDAPSCQAALVAIIVNLYQQASLLNHVARGACLRTRVSASQHQCSCLSSVMRSPPVDRQLGSSPSFCNTPSRIMQQSAANVKTEAGYPSWFRFQHNIKSDTAAAAAVPVFALILASKQLALQELTRRASVDDQEKQTSTFWLRHMLEFGIRLGLK